MAGLNAGNVRAIAFSPGQTQYVTIGAGYDYERDGEQIARNVQPLSVEPGKFAYRLVKAELEFDDYGTVEAKIRIDLGHVVTVPFTLLAPVEA